MKAVRPRSSAIYTTAKQQTDREIMRLKQEIVQLTTLLASQNVQIAELREQARTARASALRPRMSLNQPHRFVELQNTSFQYDVTMAERLRQQIARMEEAHKAQLQKVNAEHRERMLESARDVQKLHEVIEQLRAQNATLRESGGAQSALRNADQLTDASFAQPSLSESV